MAILISGVSQCLICGAILNFKDDIIATPAFLRKAHPLAKFSDAVLHRSCFQSCPESNDVEKLLVRFKEVMADAPETKNMAEYEAWLQMAMREFE